MASIHPLTQDACVLTVSAKLRLTFRKGALEMLLFPEAGRDVRRVPLAWGRDAEGGEMTLSKTGRTLEVRVNDPPRLFLADADEARAFLRGRLNALALTEATDNSAARRKPTLEELKAAAARKAAPPEPAAPAPSAAPRPVVRAPPPPTVTLDEVMRDVHTCPRGLTCRPGRGVLYPMPTMGRLTAGRADVLAVAWNPRPDLFPQNALPDYETWRRDAEEAPTRALAKGADWARRLADVLPPGRRLDDGRTAVTHLWKWPTRFRTAEGDSTFYMGRCVASHFHQELAALRPSLVVATDADAAAWFVEQAEQKGLQVNVPPDGVRTTETVGWVAPSAEAWGWPMGLVLVGDPRDDSPRWRDLTVRWARAAGERVLREAAAGSA